MTPLQAYAEGTLRLFAACIKHGNDSDEAERVREDLDLVWRRVIKEDPSAEDKITELSVFLNSYMEKHKLEK